MKASDSVYDWRRDNPLNLEVIRFFFLIYTLFNIGERSEPEKKDKNNLWPPLLPIKYPHQTPPLINLMGVRTPAPSFGSAHVST